MEIDGPAPKRRRSSESFDASVSPRFPRDDEIRTSQNRPLPNGTMRDRYDGNDDDRPRASPVSNRSSSSRSSRSSRDGRDRWQSRDRSSRSRSHSLAYSRKSYSSDDDRYERRTDYTRSSTRSRSSSSEPQLQYLLSFSPTGEPIEGHGRSISCIKFAPDGSMFASASADGTVRLWSTPTASSPSQLLATLYGHLAGVSTLAFSPDSRMLATGSDDKLIRLWALPSGTPYPIPLVGHHNYIFSLAFSPKGNMLVSGSFDEAVFLWDVRSGRIMRSLPAHSDPVGGVDFNRDGTLIASCSSDGLIRIWDAMTGQCLRTLVHEDRRQVTSVQFTPNSQFVIAWTLDQRIRLWDYTEGKCKKTYQGHENRSYSLSGASYPYETGSEEAFLVSGSEDGSIWAWDVVSKDALWTSGQTGHTDTVLAVDVTRDRQGDLLMVSAGMDHKIRLWKGTVGRGQRIPVDVGENGVVGLNGHVNGVASNIDESSEEDESEGDDGEVESVSGEDRERSDIREADTNGESAAQVQDESTQPLEEEDLMMNEGL